MKINDVASFLLPLGCRDPQLYPQRIEHSGASFHIHYYLHSRTNGHQNHRNECNSSHYNTGTLKRSLAYPMYVFVIYSHLMLTNKQAVLFIFSSNVTMPEIMRPCKDPRISLRSSGNNTPCLIRDILLRTLLSCLWSPSPLGAGCHYPSFLHLLSLRIILSDTHCKSSSPLVSCTGQCCITALLHSTSSCMESSIRGRRTITFMGIMFC